MKNMNPPDPSRNRPQTHKEMAVRTLSRDLPGGPLTENQNKTSPEIELGANWFKIQGYPCPLGLNSGPPRRHFRISGPGLGNIIQDLELPTSCCDKAVMELLCNQSTGLNMVAERAGALTGALQGQA